MSEFSVIRRVDVPKSLTGRKRAQYPQVRLHAGGRLHFSVLAVQALGNQDCEVMVEFDESESILKFTTITAKEKLPRGITENDLFPVTIRPGKTGHRPIGTVSIRSLLKHIGHPLNGKRSHEFPIVEMDPVGHSISVSVPTDDES